MIRRFFIAFAAVFLGIFGASAAHACAVDEIDVLGDGTQCESAKFTITTTEIADGETFQFYMSAKGTFYVDCGTGGTLSSSASDVSGMTITRSNTTGATYTCTYTGNTEAKTIRFGGIAATGKAYVDGVADSAAAIRFNVTPTLVASVSGSLGAIFPSRGTASAQQPRFYRTFYRCTNLTEIPSTLFSGVTGSAKAYYQFYQTFYSCRSLTSIPDGLFSDISSAPASSMFHETFYFCTGLTGSIPENLFGGISGAPGIQMFTRTFWGCRGLTGSIPPGLFGNLSGAGATNMFLETFYGCSNLSGYVPKELFENITSSTGVSNTFTNTNLYTECPCGTKSAETGWGATVVDGRAVCEVGTKDNEHWNNGVCITDCGKLKTSTGLEYPILSVATSQHSINVGVGNDVCHVPLANGGANNAINVSFDGATYHATVPDEIVPTGFTGQPAPVEPD